MLRFILLSSLYIINSEVIVVAQTTYYVSTIGSDDNNGTSLSTPWRHIDFAVNYKQLMPGDTIVIRGGTYNERVKINKSGSEGNEINIRSYANEIPVVDGNGISFTWNTYHEGIFEVASSFVVIDGLKVINSTPHVDATGILVRGPGISHVTIRNCFTENTRSSGIAAWGNSPTGTYTGITDLTIEKNTITNAVNDGYQESMTIAGGVDRFVVRNNIVRDQLNPPKSPNFPIGIDAKVNVRNGEIYGNLVYNLPLSNGIYVDAWNAHAYNIKIFGNEVHDVGLYGIQVGAEQGGTSNDISIYNNVVYNCNSYGLKVTQAYGQGVISNISLYNNTVNNNGYGNIGGGGIWIEGNTGAVSVMNNIFSNNNWTNGAYIYSRNKDSVVVENNLIWQYRNSSWPDPAMEEVKGISPVEQDPQYISAETFNFHLRNASPAINMATSSLIPDFDFDSLSRPHGEGYDIGAYEYNELITETCEVDIKGILIYQYPAKGGILYIIMSERIDHGQLSIFNLTGNCVFKQDIHGVESIRINVDNWMKGVYVVMITSRILSHVQKVIIS
jgi:hypothetical protein